MELAKWLKHAYAISIVVLLHINASLSLGHHHANVTRCVERERDALLAVKRDLVDNHNLLSSWGSGSEAHNEDCCRWERVYCDNQSGHVLRLDLGADVRLHCLTDGECTFSPAFEGKISPQLIQLHDLTYLNLSNNDFNGSQIPAFIGSLTNLRYLDLHLAGFGGQIPSHALGNLTHLQYLNLRENDFTNPVENFTWLPHLSSLKYLDLSGTNLGNIFDWLETVNMLPNLRNLSLSDCGLPPPIISSSFSQINSSKSVAHVDLSGATAIPSSIFKWLYNYNTTLVHLDLSFTQLSRLIPDVFRNMSSLKHLFLSGNQLSGLIPDAFRNMSSLEDLDLSGNQMSGLIPDAFRNMSSLEYLDLSGNQLSGLIPNVFRNMSSLERLVLSSNQLSGLIPDVFRNMSSLIYLDLSDNPLERGIYKSISQFCSLTFLRISNISLDGLFSEFVQQWSSACPQNSLQVLDLSFNDLAGSLPNLTNFSSLMELDLSGNNLSGIIPESIGQLGLEVLDLSRNRLSGRIPQSIGQLSNLYILNLSMNSLNGMILETHFSNLSSLEMLDLSYNSLVFNVTSDWVPPFQLYSLNLRNCNVGSHFPQWLRTQKNSIFFLDISYAGISDVLPSWFWGHFSIIDTIDLSHNQIRGTIGSSEVVSFLSTVTYLDLSSNKFSKTTSFLCTPNIKRLQFLKLSSNNFSEELPDCWRSLVNLELLDLSNNAFSGKISTTIGSLLRIETLKLRANRLVGELPLSLKNCTSLKVIDLGYNNLSRLMPEWLGASLPNLVILMLQSNQFSGSLPSQLCHLARIQILDLSMNDISGTIPKCLSNLTSLSQEGNSNLTIRHSFHPFVDEGANYSRSSSNHYDDDATFMWKGRMYSYKSTLGLVKRIDLSSNRLTGEIPSEITQLVGLVSLNLSRNHLTGQITPKIGNLKSLDSLDLSRNQIYGGIPTSLAKIDRLGYLDLSYNDLSGEIPTGTQLQGFDPSSYAGNPQLCGLPLKKICNPKGTSWPNVSSNQDHDKLITEGFYISLGLGFASGFWGVCGSLIFNRSWRYAYYKFLNASNDWLYVKVALIKQKLKDVLNRKP